MLSDVEYTLLLCPNVDTLSSLKSGHVTLFLLCGVGV
jgi:hypothetical protein